MSIRERIQHHRLLGIAGVFALLTLGLIAFVAARASDTEEPAAHEEHAGEGGEDAILSLTPEQMELAGIRVESLGAGQVGQVLSVPGVVHENADNTASVSPTSLGMVAKVLVNIGDRVEEGAPLAVLRSPTLAEAEAAVSTARSDLRLAEGNQVRAKALADAGEFSRPEYEDADAAYREAEQTYLRAQSELESARKLAAVGAHGGPDYDAAREAFDQATSARALAESTLTRTRGLADAGQYLGPEEERVRRESATAAAAVDSARRELDVARAELRRVEMTTSAGAADEPAEGARAARAEALAAYDSARAEATRADRELERVRTLRAQELASARELEEASAKRDSAVAALTGAEEALSIAQTQASRADRLAKGGVNSGRVLDSARAAVADAETALREAEVHAQAADAQAKRQATIGSQDIEGRQEIAEAEEALSAALASERAARAEWQRQQAIAGADLPNTRALSEAETTFRAAEGVYQVAKSRFERERAVLESGLRATQRLEEARSAVERARTQLASAQSAVRILSSGRSLGSGSFQVVAPIDGYVTRRNALKGQVASETDVLFSISRVGPVWVEALVSENDLALVRAGQPITVTTFAHPDTTFAGSLDFVDLAMDEESRRARARALVANPDGLLLPDMFVDVAIEVGSADAKVVAPQAAVLSDAVESFVFVEVQPGQFMRRDVETGLTGADGVEILEGLAAGERVVVEGAFALKAEASKSSMVDAHAH